MSDDREPDRTPEEEVRGSGRKARADEVSCGHELLLDAMTAGTLKQPIFEPTWFEITGIRGGNEDVTFYNGDVALCTRRYEEEVTIR